MNEKLSYENDKNNRKVPESQGNRDEERITWL